MTFGLRRSQPTGRAPRPHLASLPVRVPTVEGLPRASFGFASGHALRFGTVVVINFVEILSSR